MGCSIITDLCLPDTLEPVSLSQILAVAERSEPSLTSLVSGVVAKL
jgi:purine-nucleoside phosphorylase